MHAPLKGRVFTAELGRKKRDSTKTEQLLSHLKEQKKKTEEHCNAPQTAGQEQEIDVKQVDSAIGAGRLSQGGRQHPAPTYLRCRARASYR